MAVHCTILPEATIIRRRLKGNAARMGRSTASVYSSAVAQPYLYSGAGVPRLVDGFRVRPQSLEGSLRAYAVEALGTFILTFVCGASLCIDAYYGQLGQGGVALAQGMTLAGLVIMFTQISGAQFNPAITLALMAVGHQKAWHGALYIVAQVIGGILAGFVLRGLFERFDLVATAPFLGTPYVAPELSALEGMGIEAMLAFVWMVAVFATQLDPRGSKKAAPAAIGLSLAVAVLWGGPLTGAAINPARALGPALAAWQWNDLQLYIVGPIIGALAAAGFYEYVLLKPMGTSALN